MKFRSLLLGAAAAMSFAGVAQAEHFHGWYVGLEGGANWVADNNVTFIGTFPTTPFSASTRANMSFDTGWAVLATVGYGFGQHWRIEGEAGYRSNKIASAVTPSGSPIVSDGDLREMTLMANILYDIPITSRFMFTLGVGAGADYANLETSGPFEDKDWFFAYQGEAGFSYALTSRTDLMLNYRYLRVVDPSFHDTIGPVNATIAMDDIQKHTVTLGLRYALWAQEEEVQVAPPPPPPPPPAPPPPPPTTHFIIFFGFNKCNITAEADGVLSEAAQAAKSMGSAAISIVGHTDTSGSPRYNQKLSECRSNAAKTNLVGKGIPDGAISASGKGETELMVQTGDGVKEPQNRRATVDLH